MNTTDTNNTKLSGITVMDDSDDNGNLDDRDLEMYSWRHILDEARDVLDHSSIPSITSSPSTIPGSVSATTPSTKRKSTSNSSQTDKYRLK
jgi:hypothetical protein